MKILPIKTLPEVKNYATEQPLNKHKETAQQSLHQNYSTIVPQYNDYLLSFGARVDKGLERFYEVNKDIMPDRVREYIDDLPDKGSVTPMEAQRNAYEFLSIADSVEDITGEYKEFKGLKSAKDTKATSGILFDIRGFSDILEADGKGVLKNPKKDLTVYLVQKIYLENQTLEEINKALEEDLNPEFRDAFKFNNEDAQYIHHSTLEALGIKAPDRRYRQSLRYTIDGYSDLMGEKITSFWNSLSDADRTARAKKSVINFENWWASIPHDKKLELLLDQEATLKMLEQFNGQKQASRKSKPNTADGERIVTEAQAVSTPKPKTIHAKVGSAKLSQDELFIKWAQNNLKIFSESLTEGDKDKLEVKRTQALIDHWDSMSPAERTSYISRLKSGQEPLRYTMIDAWNHSFEVLKDLSEHLSEKHIERGIESIYAPEPFSDFQSRIMTEFWESHPEHAEHLGEEISKSNTKIKEAMKEGKFERLKQIIMQERSQRIKMLKAMKAKAQIVTPPPVEETYMDEFRRAYYSAPETLGHSKNLPKSYMKDYFNVIENNFDEASIRAWTKNLKGEHLTEEDIKLLEHIMHTEPEDAVKMNRVLEMVLGQVLFENTENPEVFAMTYSDMKVALAQIDRKQPRIDIVSHNLNSHFQIPIKKHKINRERIEAMYNSFMQPLKDSEMKQILHGFFKFENEESICIMPGKSATLGLAPETEVARKFLETYGQSARLIFSPTSSVPEHARLAMLVKFANNVPKGVNFAVQGYDAFLRENSIKSCTQAITRRFDFIPREMMEPYTEEVARDLRFHDSNFFEIHDFMEKIGKKRKYAHEHSKIAILPKESLSLTNRFKMLSAEQILAERLYDSTHNPSVFSLHFEELCDKFELLNLIKKFPCEETHDFVNFSEKEPVSLSFRQKPDLRGLASEFLDCYEGVITNWFQKEFSTEGFGSIKTLVENLASGETDPEILKHIEKRIRHYKFSLLR